MFDIGFFELLIIGAVSLVIIGPERLPETARAVGLWIGRLKRSLRETRGELEKQLGADDIRRQLHNEEVMRSLESTRRQVQDAVQEGAIDRPLRQYREKEELQGDSRHTGQSGKVADGSTDTAAPDTREPSTGPKASESDADPTSDTDSKPSS